MSMKTILWATAFVALSFSACSAADDQENLGTATEEASVASTRCALLFQNRFDIAGNGWSARLHAFTSGLTTPIVSIESDEGFFEDCGRSDVQWGNYTTSSVPWEPDYTMKLTLESESCGNKTIVITGTCGEDGTTGTATWQGRGANITKLTD